LHAAFVEAMLFCKLTFCIEQFSNYLRRNAYKLNLVGTHISAINKT